MKIISFLKQISYIANELTPSSRNGIYCQSLMDFANLVCKVNTPLCNECTLKNMCNFENKIENKKKKTNKNRKNWYWFFC